MNGASTLPQSVLVIDDDAVMRELMSALLDAQGIGVTTAESAGGALEALAANTPEVVLSDLHLPDAEGGTLVKWLRERCSERAVLLGMSASEPEAEVRAALDGFLLKPFDVEQFLLAVASAGAKGEGSSAKAQETGDSASPVLDQAVYDKMSASLPPAQLHELYRITLDDVSKRLELIRAAAAAGDSATCRSEAHAIKGGCGMVGAAELKAMAAALEAGAAADTPTLKNIAAAVERLRRMLDTLKHFS